jgi:glycosyltransferase involved in cell wall biosynthesis
MKVIHIIPTIHEEAAGPSYTVPRLCKALEKVGIEIELGVLGASGKHSLDFIRSFLPSKHFNKLGFSGAMFSWLKQIAVNGETSIFHSHSLWMMPNIYPGWAARGSNVKIMVSSRGTLSPYALNINKWIKKLFWIFLQGPVVRQASCLHATALSEYNDLRALGLTQPVCIIPNGIDIPDFRSKNRNSKQKTLLYIGRIHPKKGLINLLHAWAHVENNFPDWRLKIIGPNEANHLIDLINLHDRLALKKVEMIGPLYGEDKLNAYREADLFVLPTHSENFGMTVAESLAAGTPVIVTRGAPWSGIITNNAGWWIDIGIEPMVNCLKYALSLPGEDLIKMGMAGREWMIESYSWDFIAREMASVYQWLVDGGKPPKSVILT